MKMGHGASASTKDIAQASTAVYGEEVERKNHLRQIEDFIVNIYAALPYEESMKLILSSSLSRAAFHTFASVEKSLEILEFYDYLDEIVKEAKSRGVIENSFGDSKSQLDLVFQKFQEKYIVFASDLTKQPLPLHEGIAGHDHKLLREPSDGYILSRESSRIHSPHRHLLSRQSSAELKINDDLITLPASSSPRPRLDTFSISSKVHPIHQSKASQPQVDTPQMTPLTEILSPTSAKPPKPLSPHIDVVIESSGKEKVSGKEATSPAGSSTRSSTPKHIPGSPIVTEKTEFLNIKLQLPKEKVYKQCREIEKMEFTARVNEIISLFEELLVSALKQMANELFYSFLQSHEYITWRKTESSHALAATEDDIKEAIRAALEGENIFSEFIFMPKVSHLRSFFQAP